MGASRKGRKRAEKLVHRGDEHAAFGGGGRRGEDRGGKKNLAEKETKKHGITPSYHAFDKKLSASMSKSAKGNQPSQPWRGRGGVPSAGREAQTSISPNKPCQHRLHNEHRLRQKLPEHFGRGLVEYRKDMYSERRGEREFNSTKLLTYGKARQQT